MGKNASGWGGVFRVQFLRLVLVRTGCSPTGTVEPQCETGAEFPDADADASERLAVAICGLLWAPVGFGASQGGALGLHLLGGPAGMAPAMREIPGR